MNWAIPILFLMVPFGVIQLGILHQAQQVGFVLSAMVVMAWQIKDRAVSCFLTYLAMWVLFIFGFALIYFVPPFIILGAFDAVLYLGAAAMAFYCVTQTKISNKTYFNIICISALVQLAIGYSQYFGFDPFSWTLSHIMQTVSPLRTHPTGTLGNNNFLAAYLGISLPFFFRKRWAWCLILIVPMLYLSNTTSAIVPAIIASFWYFRGKLTKREQAVSIIGAVVVIIAYSCFQHTPFYENPRWVDWGAAVKQILESPWIVFVGRCPGALWGKPYPMHNEWLQIFHQYGLIGFSFVAWFVVRLLVKGKNRILTASLMVAAINMFGNYSLHLGPSAFLITLVAGLKEREIP